MTVENAIETQYIKLLNDLDTGYETLYSHVVNSKLRAIFSTLHSKFVRLFDSMNDRLPTNDFPAHFWADPSRELIQAIEISRSLERSLKNSELSFYIDSYYDQLLIQCKVFLSKSGGSEIPPKTDKVDLYYTIPIFHEENSIELDNIKKRSSLKMIGEGSYAQVFKYYDDFYDRSYAVKRAKSSLDEKEMIRFKREFEQMKQLRSPYILEVYGYDEVSNEYVMDFMDCSLYEYISRNNTKLTYPERLNIGLQVLKAFSYIHSKKILHRDISPKNILLKKYDDVIVVKISDFGLVKILESDLTSLNTEIKGCFNDPNLALEGFDNYSLLHETYALTRILFFVLTGKVKSDSSNDNLKEFLERGLNSDKSLRFKDTNELKSAFLKL